MSVDPVTWQPNTCEWVGERMPGAAVAENTGHPGDQCGDQDDEPRILIMTHSEGLSHRRPSERRGIRRPKTPAGRAGRRGCSGEPGAAPGSS